MKDECGVEYREPSQAQYYALFRDHDDSKAINEALKPVADMLGCMTHIEYQRPSSRVGEEAAVNIVGRVWQTALKTYGATLNERVSKASIKSREEWSDDYILGFFEGLTARHPHVHPRILDGLKQYKKEKNDD